MARKEKPAEKELPKLIAKREKAEELIQKQIEKGEQIRDGDIQSPEDLDNSKRQFDRWKSYNKQLLKSIFTNTSIEEEYSKFVGKSLQMNATLEYYIDNFRGDVEDSISRLQSVVDRLELIPEASDTSVTPEETIPFGRGVFIVHGHDEEMKKAVALVIKSLGLKHIILHEQPNKGMTIIEKFEDNSADVGFAVILLSPDDIGKENIEGAELHPRARQNVITEMGYFSGKLGRSRVVALYPETDDFEFPSDYSGVIYIKYDTSDGWQRKLVKELQAVGYDVSSDDLP